MESDGSNRSKALSIALGTFIGLTPFWGFHSFLSITLAVVFKLNKVLAFAFSNISLPPFIPFIIAISLGIGGFFLGTQTNFGGEELNLDFVKTHLLQYVIGTFILAIAMSALLGIGSFVLLNKVSPEGKSN